MGIKGNRDIQFWDKSIHLIPKYNEQNQEKKHKSMIEIIINEHMEETRYTKKKIEPWNKNQHHKSCLNQNLVC